METQEKMTLALSPRSVQKKKVRALRREGIVPAVIYGKDVPTTLVQVGRKDLELLYKKMHGTSIIEASLEGKNFPVLIHEVQRDNITASIIHVDFMKVDLKREVTVDVPLNFVGLSPAEKEGKGKVSHDATSITIKCSPADIPSEIEVDVSIILDKHDVIHASDLKLPEGTALGHGVSPDKVIAVLAQTKVAEVVTEAAVEETAAAPAASE